MYFIGVSWLIPLTEARGAAASATCQPTLRKIEDNCIPQIDIQKARPNRDGNDHGGNALKYRVADADIASDRASRITGQQNCPQRMRFAGRRRAGYRPAATRRS
jgi:hypothetical protein